MSYFLVSVLQAFLPVALLLGLNWVKPPTPGVRPLFLLTLAGLVLGVLLNPVIPAGQQAQLTLTLLQLMAVALFLICQFLSSLRIAFLWQLLLILIASLRWASDPNLGAITATRVINSEFLLNLSAVVVALAFVALIAVLLAMIVNQLPRLRWPLLLLTALLLALPLSGDLLLLMMKLQALGLTKPRLSYVAQVTNGGWLLNYLCAGLLLLLAVLYGGTVLRSRKRACDTLQPIVRRRALAQFRSARRICILTLIAALLVTLGQLYWDRVASQPPQLSEAVPVQLAADGLVHLPIEQLRDGKLHRFVWIADDGKAIRFFVINRYPDKLRLGVVFDACLLCGDQGYVMEGNQVICVACGVHIFIPSIGKPGGCNPVPIEGWQNDEQELTIGKAALEAGTNYFTRMVPLEVSDPVDGSRLSNLKAEFKYSYAGKTYFFASEANYNRFRDHPEQFVAADAAEGE